MTNVITQSTIWKFVGGVSAITGLVCSQLLLRHVILEVGLWRPPCLPNALFNHVAPHRGAKRIRVSERVQGVVAALIFVVICVISVVLDKYVPGESDVLSIISYGLLAALSLSVSRKSELGF